MAITEDGSGVGDGERPAAAAALCSVQLRYCRYSAEVFNLLEWGALECAGG